MTPRAIAGRSLAKWARLTCLLPALYLLSIVAFALMHFDDYASDLPRLIRYVLVPGALGLAIAAAGWALRREAALTVGLGALSVLAALFLLEAIATISAVRGALGLVGGGAVPPRDLERYERALPPSYTLKALNDALGTTSLEEAQLGGMPEAEVLLCSNEDGPVSYVADRYGFNNDDAVYDRPVNVMVLGDSFAEGICLDRDESLVGQLSQRLDGTVGFGSRGTGPLFQLAVLGRYGPALRPRTVVMAFFAGNDWENLTRSEGVDWLQDTLRDDARFGTPDAAAPMEPLAENIISSWWEEGGRGMREVFRRQAILRNFAALQQTSLRLGLHYPKAAGAQPIYGRALAKAREIAETWGGDVLLVYIPPVDRYVGLLESRFAHDGLRELVAESTRRAGVPMLDLSGKFDDEPDPQRLYAADAHFSAAGAALAATLIAEAVGDVPAEQQSASVSQLREGRLP